jgi:hypothetical protein
MRAASHIRQEYSYGAKSIQEQSVNNREVLAFSPPEKSE